MRRPCRDEPRLRFSVPRPFLPLMAAVFLDCSPATPVSISQGPAVRIKPVKARRSRSRRDLLLDAVPLRRYPLDDLLRINHIQVKATHNSFHREPLMTFGVWKYSHRPLIYQFERQGVRAVELDIHWDPDKGRFHVFHKTFLDSRSTCKRFRDCLKKVKVWSDQRPQHLPLTVFVQPKDRSNVRSFARMFRRIESEMLAVWPRSRIMTPDDVRGSYPDLVTAIRRAGWPTLGRSRGKVIFVMLASGPIRQAYTHRGLHLRGRLLFITSGPDTPYGVVMNIDNPSTGRERIIKAVKAGILVRTRSDARLKQTGRSGARRLAAALESGAHFIATDFPAAARRRKHFVRIPGGTLARCNPVTAPPSCTSDALETR